MSKLARHILFCLLTGFLAAGCQDKALDEQGPAADVPVVLELNIDVSDVPAVKGYADPESPQELMQTLRIIIARPDGIVEHNRYLDLTSHPEVMVTGQKFEVVGNELKSIYLIANEGNLKSKTAYDFSHVIVGGRLDASAMQSLTLDMSANGDELGVPVPMSAFYEVMMPQTDISRDFEIFRSAVKFTYILVNKTEFTYDVDKILVSKLSHKSFFFPDIVSLQDYSYTEDGATVTGKEITSFNIPADAGSYDFTKVYDGTQLYGFKDLRLSPIYVLESKCSGGYETAVVLNGREFRAKLELEDDLPRNTHVVVRITITEKTLDWYDLTWQVDVRPYVEFPYGDIELEPGFGL